MQPTAPPTSPSKTVSVGLIDDHLSLRQMLAVVLLMDARFRLVGEASGGMEGLRMCRSVRPQVVVLDLTLPELSGLQLIRLLRTEMPQMRVLVYTGAMDGDLLRQAMDLEPDGFVQKEDSLSDLREGLLAVSAGRGFYSSSARGLLRGSRERTLSALTSQETAVLQMIAEGRQSKEIADALCVAVKTVDHHRQNLMNKLNLHEVASLTRFAIRMKLVDPCF
jgi:DNA-binding NarL/FixJ family response regulator